MSQFYSWTQGARWYAACGCALALLALGRAQTPDVVLIAKLSTYQQTDATTQQLTGAQFGVQLSFPAGVATPTSVQLRGPSGASSTLTRQSDGSFALQQDFASPAALEAAYPDGAYTILVGGGGSTAVQVQTGAPVSPVLITNFDALQAWPSPNPLVKWQPMPGASDSDFLSLSVSRADGTEVYSTPDTFPPSSTQVVATNLPLFAPLTGDLGFAHLALTVAANGSTNLAIGRGFDVQFPLTCTSAPPTITFQPQSQVINPGNSVLLHALATGQGPLTYQWKKNGVPIPGASGTNTSTAADAQLGPDYSVLKVQAGDAGNYTVDFTNAAGTSASAVAVIALRPTFTGTIYAGTVGSPAGVMQDGPRATALFPAGPGAIAFDRSGTMYFSDGYAVRKMTADGNVSFVAGSLTDTGTVDGVGAAARFATPAAFAFDAAGNVFVADWLNFTIRKITPDGNVTTFAGAAGQRGYVDGTATSARFNGPGGIVADAAGNLYVADIGNHAIRKITPGGVVSTLAGNGTSGFTDGVGVAGRFNGPQGIAIDATGNLFVVDTGNYAIRRITPAGAVSTFAYGGAGTFYRNVATDAGGNNVYVSVGNTLLRFTRDGALAGSGLPLASIAGADATAGFITGIAVDASGKVFVAQGMSHVLLAANFVAGSADPGITLNSSPLSQVIATGGSLVLSASATGPGLGYQWRKDGSAVPGATTPRLYVKSTASSDAGSYTVVVSNGINSTSTAPAVVTLSSTADLGRMTNLSIRSAAGTGAQTLIVGFVVGGSGATASKSVLVRGIGPGLVQFGVSDALTDPAITLLNGAQVTATNDNWDGTTSMADAFASVGAFPLNAGSRDAATTAPLPPGNYTLKLTGNGGATGIGLAEIYDESSIAGQILPRLINVSTRTQVGSGSGVLIAGFAIGGSTSRTVLIRGAGPSLSGFGVTGVLPNPQLTVYSGQTVLASNDDWNNDFTISGVAQSVGAFSLTSANESAILLTLPPGLYTAQVSGVGGTTGVGLVEIYEVP